MKPFAAILSLASVASAIDLYAFNNYSCSGSWVRCAGINPGVCCTGSGFSIAAMGIPIGWQITLVGWTGGGCTNYAASGTNNGQSYICINGGYYTGEHYYFNGRKRDEAAVDSECQRPDVLGLADGTEYDLTHLASLNDDEFAELLQLGLNATSVADAPEELKLLQIK